MGLRPTKGMKNFADISSQLSSRAERPQGAQSRDLHFPRLPCLGHVLRMPFDRAKPKGGSFGDGRSLSHKRKPPPWQKRPGWGTLLAILLDADGSGHPPDLSLTIGGPCVGAAAFSQS